jgi:hypothetical protein
MIVTRVAKTGTTTINWRCFALAQRDRDRQLPPGLEYVDSWVDLDYFRCFQLMRTDNRALFEVWIEAWSDLGDFEIIPVRTSAEAAQHIADKL